MAEDFNGHVSAWITLLKNGDPSAAQSLWEYYYDRLVWLARAELQRLHHRPADRDEEDIALSAFHSFWNGSRHGRFPRLSDRTDLWRLLVFITAQKIHDCRRYQAALKHGSRNTRVNELDLDRIIGREPAPEFAFMVTEEYRRLLDRLDSDQLRQIAVWKMEGFTNEEIAAKLGCVPKTVTNRLRLIREIWKQSS